MFKYKDVGYLNIIKNVNITLEENAVTSLVGPSGSGKTTFLRMLNKMISPDRGEIFYRGVPLQDRDSVALRREVVMLSQNPAMYPGSIRDNLLIGLRFSEKPSVDDAALKRLMADLRLNMSLGRDAKKLSGGEQQRIALGRVLLMQPEVLLLDEPSSALDWETENMIMEELISYTRKNRKTLIMVTHSREIAEEFSDRILHMNAGTLSEEKA